MDFTKEQQQVIRHGRGHALVSAVAGSGKTTTMVARVRHLLASGCDPGKLLVLMFNRSASRHFEASLHRRLAGTGLTAPQVRTFHALGLRLVESFMRRGALPRRKLVTEEYRREKLAKQALTGAFKKEFGSRAWMAREDLEAFLCFIDLVKSTTETAARCFEELNFSESYEYFLDGFASFENMRRHAGMRFYDDLIRAPLTAMLADSALAGWVGNRVDHIIVDEYQDINEAQQQLLQILAGSRAEVMAVGDVDQCIYEWRGARPEYITTRFHKDFPKPTRYTLSFTFRYGHRLSLAANHLIERNKLRDRKMCLSAPGNSDTRVERCEETEPHPILRVVKEWLQGGRKIGEAAVLVRLFALSVPLELALLEAGIPYRLEGHERVFQCREIKALIGYLKLRTGQLGDDEREVRADYLRSMLSQPHLGVVQEELDKLAEEMADQLDSAPGLILARVGADMPVFQQKRLEKVAIDWQWLLRPPTDRRADLLLDEIVNRLELYEFYHKFSSRQIMAENRIATCRAFIDFAARQQSKATAFLSRLRALEHAALPENGDSLLITSIHRAKGLEWPLVIVPGLQDGIFPLLAEDDAGMIEGNLEDERRLFYVAITRAVERLILMHPTDRLLEERSRTGSTDAPIEILTASRFVYEANLMLSDRLGAAIATGNPAARNPVTACDINVAKRYLEYLGLPSDFVRPPAATLDKRKKNAPASSQFLRIADIGEGLEILHHQLGPGIVTRVLDRSQGQVRVFFEEHGEKTLLVDFARLLPLSGR